MAEAHKLLAFLLSPNHKKMNPIEHLLDYLLPENWKPIYVVRAVGSWYPLVYFNCTMLRSVNSTVPDAGYL